MTNTNTNYLFTYLKAHIISSQIITPVNTTLKTQPFISATLVRKTISIFQNAEPDLRQNTIIYQGPKLWNALPDGIKSSKSLNIFKKTVEALHIIVTLIFVHYYCYQMMSTLYTLFLFLYYPCTFFKFKIFNIQN